MHFIATQEPSRKIRNIRRNQHVTILIDTTDMPFKGAVVYGVAQLDYEDVIPKRVTIFERRLSREEAEIYARRLSGKWRCVIVRVTPVHIASFDYSTADSTLLSGSVMPERFNRASRLTCDARC